MNEIVLIGSCRPGHDAKLWIEDDPDGEGRDFFPVDYKTWERIAKEAGYEPGDNVSLQIVSKKK